MMTLERLQALLPCVCGRDEALMTEAVHDDLGEATGSVTLCLWPRRGPDDRGCS
jgi:hypothetical protein